jgi:plastocyanin
MTGLSILRITRPACIAGWVALAGSVLLGTAGCPTPLARSISGGNVNRNARNVNTANGNAANQNENAGAAGMAFNVAISDQDYVPETLTIHVGDRVRWTNNGTEDHTVTSGDPGDPANIGLRFASMPLRPGDTFEVTFDQAGAFDYFDMIHPDLLQDAAIFVQPR